MTNIKAYLGMFALAAPIALSVPSDASAWETVTCTSNGALEHGIHGPATFRVLGCPAAAWELAIIEDAVHEWNDLTGMLDRFSTVHQGAQCSPSVAASWGNWELGFVNPSHPRLGSKVGVMHAVHRTCADGGGIVGAQILISDALELEPQRELDTKGGARQVLIHELGHALGMDHDNTRMSVMSKGTPMPKVGRRSGAPSDSLGRHAETMWSTDVNFALIFHASTSTGRPDAAVSPWTFVASKHVLHYDAAQTSTKCPGETVEINYTAVNLGQQSFSNLPVHIVLSSNDNISIADRLVYEASATRESGQWATNRRVFTVPAMAAGLYHVGVIIDPYDAVVEDDEYNNASETGLRVRIPPGC